MTRGVVGIDEVGRGPLAGPVAVGAVFATATALRAFRGVKESKQLSPRQREAWEEKMRECMERDPDSFRYRIAFVSALVIDRIGIAPAIRRALAQAIRDLAVDPGSVRVLLDGGLHAPTEYTDQTTIIRGDVAEPVIALASIAAKVARDRRMYALARRCPGYGFERHVGYGTKAHIAAIKKYGLTSEHRTSFTRRIVAGDEDLPFAR